MRFTQNRYLAAVVAGVGCFITYAAAAPSTAPSSNPSASVFQNRGACIRFKYPADWKLIHGKTALFDACDPAKEDGSAGLCLDVPSLPPPIFRGLITAKMVEHGYVDDLRKNQIHDAKVDESVEVKVPASSARRVKCSGHEDGKPAIDVAVLIVHADRVYIFSCDSDDAGYTKARAALDLAVGSTEWIK